MASQKQIDANRRNAQKSAGPKTPEGRAAVRFNALRHGLAAESAVIPGEDPEHFEQFRDAFLAEYRPAGPTQELLVQQIAMAAWRLQRIRAMESGMFKLRMLDLEEGMNEDYHNLDTQHQHAYIFLSDARGPNTFASLSRYEARAERSFFKALCELQRLQVRPPGPASPPACAPDAGADTEPVPESPPPAARGESKSTNQSQFSGTLVFPIASPPPSSPGAPLRINGPRVAVGAQVLPVVI